jgi:hypothetical protein
MKLEPTRTAMMTSALKSMGRNRSTRPRIRDAGTRWGAASGVRVLALATKGSRPAPRKTMLSPLERRQI